MGSHPLSHLIQIRLHSPQRAMGGTGKLIYTPLLGLGTDDPLSALLEFDGFRILLDCGWHLTLNIAQLEPLFECVALQLCMPWILHLSSLSCLLACSLPAQGAAHCGCCASVPWGPGTSGCPPCGSSTWLAPGAPHQHTASAAHGCTGPAGASY